MKRSLFTIVVISLLAAQAATAGLFYSALNTTEGGGSAADWRVNAWVDGDKAKIEFTSSANPLLPVGAYLLTTDGGQNVFMVNPQEGTYSRWDIEAMLQMASSLLEATGGMVSMTVESPSVELLAQESGSQMVGQPTTYYRYRTAYDLNMKIMGMKRTQSTILNQEVWSTDQINHPAFGFWQRKTPPSFGDSGLDALIRAEMEKMKGFPLKTVTESIVTGKKGKETRTRTVMEVTELREESIAGETFVMDPNLVEQPMPTFAPEGAEGQEEGGLRGLLKGRRRDG